MLQWPLHRAPGVHEVRGDRVREFGGQLEPNVPVLALHQVLRAGHPVLDPALAAIYAVRGDPQRHPVTDRPAVDGLYLGLVVLGVTDAQHPFHLPGGAAEMKLTTPPFELRP